MILTQELVKSWSPCADGYKYFLDHFPQGGEYGDVQAKLRADKKCEWSAWLTNAAWSHAIAGKDTATWTEAEVKRTIAEVAGSPNSSSGNYSTAASSGYYSTAD